MRAQIANLSPGFVPDPVDVLLPDGAFTDSRNFRFNNGSVDKAKGYQAVFGSLSASVIWASYIGTGTSTFWLYGKENVIYATDGSTHANVSSISYNASLDLGYTGGRYHGYQIANDAINPPQTWSPSLSNKFQPLANWPASTTCKVIRPFGDFLVALRVTESGTYNPRLIRWSDIGGVSSLPASWDYTDPTNFSGRTELGETDDYLIDCLPMRDVNIVYKQFTTYLMQYLPGSSDVFAFRRIFDNSGLLSENCAVGFGPMHFAVTADDIIVHDGSSIQYIANKRVRQWFFNTIDQSKYQRTFVVHNSRVKEIMICFCQAGHTFPNLALCWDYSNDAWYPRDLGVEMSCAATGVVSGTSTTFDADSGTFDSDSNQFDTDIVSAFANQVVLFGGGSPAAYQTETGETLNGALMTCYVERQNVLSQDSGSVKRVRRIYPKIIGTDGDTVPIYVGASDTQGGTITYSGPFNFTIGTDYKIDCRVSGRWIHVKFYYVGGNTVRLASYDVEYEPGEGAR